MNTNIWENDALAPSTLRIYKSHWDRFTAWDPAQGLEAENVVKYLGVTRGAGSSLSNLRGIVAALGYVSVQLGQPSVAKDPLVKNYLAAVARNDVTIVRKAAPLTLKMIHMVELDDEDANLLETGLRLGMRRSELVRIEWDHIDLDRFKKEIFIPKAKQGSRTVALPEAVIDILGRQISHQTDMDYNGPWVFPARKGEGHVSENTVNRLVKRVAEGNGFDPDDYSGHSLRSGFVTAAFDQGVPVKDIAAVTGHKTWDQVLSYARSVGVDLDS